MLEWITNPEAWIALATLTSLEIVLGIDNIIFISILVARLPAEQRNKGRNIGLILAMVARILLLFSLTWVMGLTKPLFELFSYEISGRDLILIIGGLFLLAKSTHEIHNSLEVEEETKHVGKVASLASVLTQIAILDIVFSLDSVITAVGLANDIEVMVIAIILAVIVMILSAKALGEFVDNHPTIKMLALSFLILVGISLIGEGMGMHIPKGYIYFAMVFSIAVEMLNLKLRKRSKAKIKLRKTVTE